MPVKSPRPALWTKTTGESESRAEARGPDRTNTVARVTREMEVVTDVPCRRAWEVAPTWMLVRIVAGRELLLRARWRHPEVMPGERRPAGYAGIGGGQQEGVRSQPRAELIANEAVARGIAHVGIDDLPAAILRDVALRVLLGAQRCVDGAKGVPPAIPLPILLGDDIGLHHRVSQPVDHRFQLEAEEMLR